MICQVNETVFQKAESHNQDAYHGQCTCCSPVQHDLAHVIVKGVKQIIRAQFKFSRFGNHGLVVEKNPKEGHHQGKGEKGEKCAQNIENNILNNLPFIWIQVF